MRPEVLPLESEPDPVIEAYKQGVDMTLIRENLNLTQDQRLRRLQSILDSLEELRRQRHTFRPRPVSE